MLGVYNNIKLFYNNFVLLFLIKNNTEVNETGNDMVEENSTHAIELSTKNGLQMGKKYFHYCYNMFIT